MKKTVSEMLMEMFTANYSMVYTLAPYNRYKKFQMGKMSKDAIENYILNSVRHGCIGPRVNEVYHNFTASQRLIGFERWN